MAESEPEYMLDIDDEIEAAGDLEERFAALIAADENRALWGLARAYQRLLRESGRLIQERDTIALEYAQRGTTLLLRTQAIGHYIEDIVRARRERGDGNAVDLPGIGRWSARKVAAGWDVAGSAEAERAVVAFLRDSYEAEAAEIIEDRPHIRRDQLRAWLDSLDDETVVPVVERLGEYIHRRPERVSVSFKEGS